MDLFFKIQLQKKKKKNSAAKEELVILLLKSDISYIPVGFPFIGYKIWEATRK